MYSVLNFIFGLYGLVWSFFVVRDGACVISLLVFRFLVMCLNEVLVGKFICMYSVGML